MVLVMTDVYEMFGAGKRSNCAIYVTYCYRVSPLHDPQGLARHAKYQLLKFAGLKRPPVQGTQPEQAKNFRAITSLRPIVSPNDICDLTSVLALAKTTRCLPTLSEKSGVYFAILLS